MTSKLQLIMRATLGVLVILSGLCTIVVSVGTAVQAWQEHAQEKWPEVTAHVDSCELEQVSDGGQKCHISCRLSYAVGPERNVATVSSRNAPSRGVWQYPRNQIRPLEEWIEAHPPGTPISLRYDPAKHTEVVAMDKLIGGTHTQGNIRCLRSVREAS